MQQVYFTNQEVGKGQSGVQVRGASAGVADGRVAVAGHYAGYAAPVVQPDEAAAFAPPVRLAWLDTPDAGRLLCHSTCLGLDPETGKNGHFFSHLLLDVPATLDAQHAIQTWGSQLWQRADHGGAAALPEPLYLPVSSALGDARLSEFLERPVRRELFQFVLSALLGAPQRRIFVAAPAEDVALCVYGVTRVLPPALVEAFTFSTYEHEPLTSPARLVGTCWPEGAGRDLPAACYAGAGVGFNGYTGRRSPEVAAVPFAEFAVEALAAGQPAALDEFHATWQRLGVQDAGLLDTVFRLARGTGTLAREESHAVLHHPTLGAWIAARADALPQFLEWGLEDHAYATATFARVVALLRQKPDVLARLAQAVEERGLAALRDGDLPRTRNALEVILPMAAPARAAAVWGDLLHTLADAEALGWEMRCYLLPRLARLQGNETTQANPALERWLHVTPDRLEALLQLDLPQSYHVTACLASLRTDGPTPPLARALAAAPRLLLSVLKQAIRDDEGAAQVGLLFETMLAEAPERTWVEEIIRHGRELSPSLVDCCLGTALEKNAVEARTLARDHGPALLDLLAGRPSLDRLARRLLEQSADELLADFAVGTFLRGLAAQAGLSPDVRERLDACLTVQTFLQKPSLDRDVLTRVMAALKLEPPLFPPRTLGRVLDAITAELAVHAGLADVQAELEGVLLTVGPHTVGGATGLFRELLHRQEKQKTFWKQPELLRAFLAISLGAPQSAELAAQLDSLEAEAFALAKRTGELGGKKVLAAIERHVESWPRAAQTQWHFLVKAVQPRGLRDVARDAGLFLGGAAALLAVVLGMRWLGMM